MKIYLVGSHSVGKTTLARYISAKYSIPFLNEIARTVLAEKELSLQSLRTSIDTVNDYQKEIFFRQFEEEKKYTSFVSDRSFDNMAYMAQHSTVFAKHLQDPKLTEYIDSIKQKNVVMFFVRPTKMTMKNDGVRENVVWDQIVSIDAMIKMLLEMFELNYIPINVDSMQERVKTINSVLSLVTDASKD